MAPQIDATYYFGASPKTGLIFLSALPVSSLMAAPGTSLNLNPELWRAINDDVMGGVSLGSIVAVDHGLRFQGQLSLDNNGGFVSDIRQLGLLLADGKAGLFRLDESAPAAAPSNGQVDEHT